MLRNVRRPRSILVGLALRRRRPSSSADDLSPLVSLRAARRFLLPYEADRPHRSAAPPRMTGAPTAAAGPDGRGFVRG